MLARLWAKDMLRTGGVRIAQWNLPSPATRLVAWFHLLIGPPWELDGIFFKRMQLFVICIQLLLKIKKKRRIL